MVNSGWCSGAPLAVAEHAGEAEDPRLARRQQLLAGELRRGVQVERPAAPPAGVTSSVAKACRCASLPGETCRAAVSTSTKPRVLNHSPQGRQDAAARQQERPPVGMDVAAPTRARGRSSLPSVRPFAKMAGEPGAGSVWCAPTIRGARPSNSQYEEDHREGYRQLGPQGQRPRHRRQALCRPDRRKLPSRQGHADDADRHAPASPTA